MAAVWDWNGTCQIRLDAEAAALFPLPRPRQGRGDIVIESRNRIWGVEIKAAASASTQDIKGLLKLASIAGERFQQGIVFYDGQATLPLNKHPEVLAVPISKLWKL